MGICSTYVLVCFVIGAKFQFLTNAERNNLISHDKPQARNENVKTWIEGPKPLPHNNPSVKIIDIVTTAELEFKNSTNKVTSPTPVRNASAPVVTVPKTSLKIVEVFSSIAIIPINNTNYTGTSKFRHDDYIRTKIVRGSTVNVLIVSGDNSRNVTIIENVETTSVDYITSKDVYVTENPDKADTNDNATLAVLDQFNDRHSDISPGSEAVRADFNANNTAGNFNELPRAPEAIATETEMEKITTINGPIDELTTEDITTLCERDDCAAENEGKSNQLIFASRQEFGSKAGQAKNEDENNPVEQGTLLTKPDQADNEIEFTSTVESLESQKNSEEEDAKELENVTTDESVVNNESTTEEFLEDREFADDYIDDGEGIIVRVDDEEAITLDKLRMDDAFYDDENSHLKNDALSDRMDDDNALSAKFAFDDNDDDDHDVDSRSLKKVNKKKKKKKKKLKSKKNNKKRRRNKKKRRKNILKEANQKAKRRKITTGGGKRRRGPKKHKRQKKRRRKGSRQANALPILNIGVIPTLRPYEIKVQEDWNNQDVKPIDLGHIHRTILTRALGAMDTRKLSKGLQENQKLSYQITPFGRKIASRAPKTTEKELGDSEAPVKPSAEEISTTKPSTEQISAVPLTLLIKETTGTLSAEEISGAPFTLLIQNTTATPSAEEISGAPFTLLLKETTDTPSAEEISGAPFTLLIKETAATPSAEEISGEPNTTLAPEADAKAEEIASTEDGDGGGDGGGGGDE